MINVLARGDCAWVGELWGVIHAEPYFPHLRNRDNDAHFIWLLYGFDEAMPGTQQMLIK